MASKSTKMAGSKSVKKEASKSVKQDATQPLEADQSSDMSLPVLSTQKSVENNEAAKKPSLEDNGGPIMRAASLTPPPITAEDECLPTSSQNKLFLFCGVLVLVSLILIAVLAAVLSPYNDIALPYVRLSVKGVTDYRSMYWDDLENVLTIGARDTIVAYKPNGTWPRSFPSVSHDSFSYAANETAVKQCEERGRHGHDHDACTNGVTYVTLDVKRDHFLFCGTDAFNPGCSVVRKENLNMSSSVKESEIESMAPPYAWKTSYLNRYDEEYNYLYYVGSVSDKSSLMQRVLQGVQPFAANESDPSTTSYPKRSQESRENFWINQGAQMVGSFLHNGHFYFLFNERDIDHDDQMVTRIARVCRKEAKDPENTAWNSFMKAKISCLDDARMQEQIVSMSYDEQRHILFTLVKNYNRWAICSYMMDGINFLGPQDGTASYLVATDETQPDGTHTRKSSYSSVRTSHYNCERADISGDTEINARAIIGTTQVMRPSNAKPILEVKERSSTVSHLETLHLARAVSEGINREKTLFFIATGGGNLWIYSWSSGDRSACLMSRSTLVYTEDGKIRKEIHIPHTTRLILLDSVPYLFFLYRTHLGIINGQEALQSNHIKKC